MTAPMLSPGCMDLIVKLASRRQGTTRPECRWRFDVSYLAIWRAFERLQAEGLLEATSVRRPDWLGIAKKPATVFRARRSRRGGGASVDAP